MHVLSGDNDLDKIVDMIIVKSINVYCFHVTLKLGMYTTTSEENIIFHHGMEEKSNRKVSISSGVIIILGP